MIDKKLFKVDLIISIMKRPRREYDRPSIHPSSLKTTPGTQDASLFIIFHSTRTFLSSIY